MLMELKSEQRRLVVCEMYNVNFGKNIMSENYTLLVLMSKIG